MALRKPGPASSHEEEQAGKSQAPCLRDLRVSGAGELNACDAESLSVALFVAGTPKDSRGRGDLFLVDLSGAPVEGE